MGFINSSIGCTAAGTSTQIPAEHLAAIAAALAVISSDIPDEHIAVIAAALAAYDELPAEVLQPILRLSPRQKFWAMSGREAIMSGRADFHKK